ncbi:MAG TPA: type IX secretion system membrane protein PorP/SprF [Flavisolibacter sp.]|nr:type IX secretion system membrane protein PorP/SprF [Flavisolibacter sp.]
MKNINLLIVFLISSVAARAQQITSSSFYDMSALLHNPAAVGVMKKTIAGATYRTQWNSMPGNPNTGVVFANTFMNQGKIGIGGYLYNDVTGPSRRTGLQAAYAYHIQLNEKAIFSMGIEGRFQQFSLDRQKLEASLGSNDPVLSGDLNKLKGDAGVGVAYTSSTFSIGASVSQLIQSKLNFFPNNNPESARNYRHYYLQSNYVFDLDNETKIIPNLLLIYLPNAPTEVQGGVRVSHNNLLWYGLSWRGTQAWLLSAGLKLAEQFHLGYSFDIYSKPVSIYDGNSNGHELMLRYEFKK